MIRRQLHFPFQEPGTLEAIASDSTQEQTGESIVSREYGDTSTPDLMVDYRLTRRVLQHALAGV